MVAAERLKRAWLGIDQSVQAVKVTELRLMQGRDLFSSDFALRLHKYDIDALKAQNPYAFEGWLVTQFAQQGNVLVQSATQADVQRALAEVILSVTT